LYNSSHSPIACFTGVLTVVEESGYGPLGNTTEPQGLIFSPLKFTGAYPTCLISVVRGAESVVLADTKIDAFDPKAIPVSDFYLLVQLDSLIDAGISPASFQELFTQCHTCHTHIARPNVAYHDCTTAQSRLARHGPSRERRDREQLLHSVTSDGLPKTRFEALFTRCNSCDRIVTLRASTYHDCITADQGFGYLE